MDIIIAQILGIIAFLLFVSSIQLKNKRQLLTFQLLANFFYAIEYLLLLAPTATFMNLISVVRCFIFFFFDEKKKKVPVFYPIIIILLIILVGIFTWNGIISLIPIGITIAYTLSTLQSDLKITRITFIICAIFWIIYNINVGAYASLIGNTFEIISGIVSLIRFKKKTN